MTIAVAAIWPWDYVLDLAGLPKEIMPGAAILLSDSRWTFIDPSNTGGQPSRHEDEGTKLFQIANDAGAVYAGHVAAGEECLSRLARRFGKKMIKKPVTRMSRDLFRAVYSRHNTKHPLRVFLGACSPRGQAELWYFGSERNFEPIKLTGVELLAWPNTEQVFRTGLEQIIKDDFSNPSNIPLTPHLKPDLSKRVVPLHPDRGAMWLAIALRFFVLDPEVDETVGGKIQCAIIDRGGFRTMGVSFTSNPEDPGTWQEMSPGVGELKTLLPRTRRGRISPASADIALRQIMR